MPRLGLAAYPPFVPPRKTRPVTRSPGTASTADVAGGPRTHPDLAAVPVPPLPAPTADDLLVRAVAEAARLLDADGAMVYLLDPVAGVLRFAHDAGIRDEHS